MYTRRWDDKPPPPILQNYNSRLLSLFHQTVVTWHTSMKCCKEEMGSWPPMSIEVLAFQENSSLELRKDFADENKPFYLFLSQFFRSVGAVQWLFFFFDVHSFLLLLSERFCCGRYSPFLHLWWSCSTFCIWQNVILINWKYHTKRRSVIKEHRRTRLWMPPPRMTRYHIYIFITAFFYGQYFGQN